MKASPPALAYKTRFGPKWSATTPPIVAVTNTCITRRNPVRRKAAARGGAYQRWRHALRIPGSATDNPHDAMFAWAEVSVLADGKVNIAVHGFPDAATRTKQLAQWQLKVP